MTAVLRRAVPVRFTDAYQSIFKRDICTGSGSVEALRYEMLSLLGGVQKVSSTRYHLYSTSHACLFPSETPIVPIHIPVLSPSTKNGDGVVGAFLEKTLALGTAVSSGSLTRTMVRRMRIGDMREELFRRGFAESQVQFKNRAQLLTLLLDSLVHRSKFDAPAPNPGIVTPLLVSSAPSVTPQASSNLSSKDDRSRVSPRWNASNIGTITLDPSRVYILTIKGLTDKVSNGTGIGIVLRDEFDDCVVWLARQYYPSRRSLFEAEYCAIVLALRYSLRHFGLRNIRMQIDHSVIVRQLTGLFKVEKESLLNLYGEVTRLQEEFAMTSLLTFEHITKLQNAESESLAVTALATYVSMNMGGDEEGQDFATLSVDPMGKHIGQTNSIVTAGEPDTQGSSVNSSLGLAQNNLPEANIEIHPSKTYKLQIDGGARGNPGIAGAGMVIFNDLGQEIWCGWKFLGTSMTNNQAEYHAVLLGLECARSLGIERILVEGDSLLVIRQLTGAYKVKNDALRDICRIALKEAEQFKDCKFLHIYRENNKRADWLANNGKFESVWFPI